MIKIHNKGKYIQHLEQLIEQDNKYQELVDKRVKWFRNNQKDTRLRTHALKKRMQGKWAFSIDEDIRIVFVWQNKTKVKFLDIGTHEEVYGRSLEKL